MPFTSIQDEVGRNGYPIQVLCCLEAIRENRSINGISPFCDLRIRHES